VMTKSMVKVNSIIQMVKLMMGIGLMANNMDMGNLLVLMDRLNMVFGTMVKELNGLMLEICRKRRKSEYLKFNNFSVNNLRLIIFYILRFYILILN
jgi:hypothetical protein